MKLNNEELKKIYFGAYEFKETDGWLASFQYSKPQVEYFKNKEEFLYDRCIATTAKTLEVITSATKISFDYKITWKGSEDSFELYIDGLCHKIFYVKDIEDEGTLVFEMPEGSKNVTIYLAADATVLIKNFEIDADYDIPQKKTKVLWLGDSITQGYGPLRSSCTYVSIANRVLDYDIVNQGIGGYVYDKLSLMKMPGYDPDKLIVALGTNQYGSETMTDVEEYYERLFSIYGMNIPTLVITPIWRGDHPEEYDIFLRYCEGIKSVCSRYENIKIVDGLKLVPHLYEYYLDGLHPNCLGTQLYAENLISEIDLLGF